MSESASSSTAPAAPVDVDALLAETVPVSFKSSMQIHLVYADMSTQAPKSAAGVIDNEVFQQIRDMDEDDDEGSGDEDPNAFSRSIVWGFFDQAESTFKEIEEAL